MLTKTVTYSTIQEGNAYAGDDLSGHREETRMNKVIVLALILITVCFLWSFKTLSRVIRGIGYCWRTQKCRNLCIPHAFLEGKKAWETDARKSTARTLKPDRLRARSCRPFLPAPRRTGLDTCRIIRLSGFLVSLTLARCDECLHDILCRVGYSCVFAIS